MASSRIVAIHPASPVPIYRQLVDQVLAMRASGQLAAGAYLPSVRQVATACAINPMTVSKAWTILEQAGVVESVPGLGKRLIPGAVATPPERQAMLTPLLASIGAEAYRLRIPRQTVLDAMDDLLPPDTVPA